LRSEQEIREKIKEMEECRKFEQSIVGMLCTSAMILALKWVLGEEEEL